MAKHRPLDKQKEDVIDDILIKLSILYDQLDTQDGQTITIRLASKELSALKLLNQRLNPYLKLTEE